MRVIARICELVSRRPPDTSRPGPGVSERAAYSVYAVGPRHGDYPGEFQWGVRLEGYGEVLSSRVACRGYACRREVVVRCGGKVPAYVAVLRDDGAVVDLHPFHPAA